MSEAVFLDLLCSGVRAYVSAGSAEPLALYRLLAAHPDRLAGVDLIGSFVPGVNRTDYAALHPEARMTTQLLPGDLRPSFEAGRVSVLPLAYTGFAAHLQRHPPDIAIVQVTPPDQRGMCSLGPAADFAPLVWKAAKQRVAFVNPSLPRAPGSWAIPFGEIDVAIECDDPAIALPQVPPPDAALAIAAHAASLIEDGATLQIGLGGPPAVIARHLTDRRNLTIHSGMISDEVVALHTAGALRESGHCTGIAIGTPSLYDWLEHSEGLEFVPTPQTHGTAAISARQSFMAINSALEVDLFGQINLEWRGGKLASGIGGAPDFAAGARLSEGGLAVIALQSTAKSKSRIVSRLTAPGVSLSRNMIDVVVTEHGIAHIRDLPMEPRAQALIGIAAPDQRALLQQEWETLRDSL